MQKAERKPKFADKLDDFRRFSFELILLIFTQADGSGAVDISEFVDGFVSESNATDVVKLSNESAIGKVVELRNESAIGKVVELPNGSKAIGKVVELPNGSRAIGKVGFAKRQPRPAGKISS